MHFGSLSLTLGRQRPLGNDGTSETHPRIGIRHLHLSGQTVVRFQQQFLRFVTLGTRFFSGETLVFITLMGTRNYHIILSEKDLCMGKRQTWSVTARLHLATQPTAGGKCVLSGRGVERPHGRERLAPSYAIRIRVRSLFSVEGPAPGIGIISLLRR